MSQRTGGFRGGVQDGTTASSVESTTLDSLVRACSKALADNYREPLSWSRGYDADTLATLLGVPAGHIAGAEPDGGMWLVTGADGRPLMASEAKKQGVAGNAIERWYKNHAIYRALGTEIYVTFCTGEGFFNGNSAQRILETAVALDPDERHRLEAGQVWNVPVGRMWFYRFHSAPTQAEVTAVLEQALVAATARRNSGSTSV